MIVMAVSNLAYRALEALTTRKRRGLKGLLRSHVASPISRVLPTATNGRFAGNAEPACQHTHQQTLSESEARSREAGTRRKNVHEQLAPDMLSLPCRSQVIALCAGESRGLQAAYVVSQYTHEFSDRRGLPGSSEMGKSSTPICNHMNFLGFLDYQSRPKLIVFADSEKDLTQAKISRIFTWRTETLSRCCRVLRHRGDFGL